MQTTVQIAFRYMNPSPAVEARVREHVERLERFYGPLAGWRVIIEGPPGYRDPGLPFHIQIDVTAPGRAISVRSERAEPEAHTDVYLALRDAFDATKRLLQDQAHRYRGPIATQAPVVVPQPPLYQSTSS